MKLEGSAELRDEGKLLVIEVSCAPNSELQHDVVAKLLDGSQCLASVRLERGAVKLTALIGKPRQDALNALPQKRKSSSATQR